MTIDKAIELKQRYQYILKDASFPELIEADNLSIEALKAWQNMREGDNQPELWILPGETKE